MRGKLAKHFLHGCVTRTHRKASNASADNDDVHRVQLVCGERLVYLNWKRSVPCKSVAPFNVADVGSHDISIHSLREEGWPRRLSSVGIRERRTRSLFHLRVQPISVRRSYTASGKADSCRLETGAKASARPTCMNTSLMAVCFHCFDVCIEMSVATRMKECFSSSFVGLREWHTLHLPEDGVFAELDCRHRLFARTPSS